jgi:8-oxo-dGTP pyrophosphatase MutT (NUDIX family)
MSRKEPRAGCILVNTNDDILIVHNVSSDFWGFPKGGKYDYENHLEAALRELREETGIKLDEKLIVTSFSSNKSRLFIARGDFKQKCRVDRREIDAYKWISLSELKKLKTSKFTQAFFGRVEKFLSGSVNPSIPQIGPPT